MRVSWALTLSTARFLALVLASLTIGQVGEAAPEPAGSEATAGVRKPAQGVIVVSAHRGCEEAAKALARQLYAAPELRPAIDEQTARALVTAPEPAQPDAAPPPAPPAEPQAPAEGAVPPAAPPERTKLDEIREVVSSIRASCKPRCDQSSVARRLIASLGSELGARLVVVVSCEAAPEQPAAATARVLQVAEARFMPIVLSTRAQTDAAPKYRWEEAARVLRGLVAPPPASDRTGRRAAKRAQPKKPSPHRRPGPLSPNAGDEAEEEDDGLDLLSSPWFWGGIGAVVAVGVTVFALSQTSLNEPDVIRVEGRVSP